MELEVGTEVPEELHRLVRWLRERAGMQQRELAAALDVVPATVMCWETEPGKRHARPIRAEQLAALLTLAGLDGDERIDGIAFRAMAAARAGA